MKVERTFVLVKPEAMEFLKQTVGMLREKNLQVCLIVILGSGLSEEHINALYPGIKGVVKKALCHHLVGSRLAVVIVEGENAVKIVCALKGDDIDPSKCAHDSLRFRFCRSCKPVQLGGGYQYFPNGFHAPKPDEVEEQMGAFKEFFMGF